MNAKEAADRLRPTFHLESMPAEDRHHVKFVEEVAAELGVEPTPFNLHQVAGALDDANIYQDSNEYPKMLFSRQHHAVKGIEASVYDPRHDYVYVHVASEEQAHELGAAWIENAADLPARADTPINAPEPANPSSMRLLTDYIDSTVAERPGSKAEAQVAKADGDDATSKPDEAQPQGAQ